MSAPFAVGDDVIPADYLHSTVNPYGMAGICETYHSRVTHGRVVAVLPEYADSVYVVWWTNEGPQTVAYGLFPSMLQHD